MGRPAIFTKKQQAERARVRRLRAAAAAARAKTELIQKYGDEFRTLYEAHLAAIAEAEGPLPHEDIARAYEEARLKDKIETAEREAAEAKARLEDLD